MEKKLDEDVIEKGSFYSIEYLYLFISFKYDSLHETNMAHSLQSSSRMALSIRANIHIII